MDGAPQPHRCQDATRAPGRAALAQLRRELPPGAQLEQAAGQVRETLDMTSAFATNLTAMSLLALLVSALLIYGAVSFTVIQRRRSIAILRALGRDAPGDPDDRADRSGCARQRLERGLGVLLGLAVGHEPRPPGLADGQRSLLRGRGAAGRAPRRRPSSKRWPPASARPWSRASCRRSRWPAASRSSGSGAPRSRAAPTPWPAGCPGSVLHSRWPPCALIAGSRRSVFAGFAALFLLLAGVAAVTPLAVLRALARLASQGRSPASAPWAASRWRMSPPPSAAPASPWRRSAWRSRP